jgi:hypothetical protein
MTGMEPFIDPLAGGLVGVLIDAATKIGGGFAQAVGDRFKATTACQKYADRYTARYGEIFPLGMERGIPLEGLYTEVRFLDKLSIGRFESLKTLEKVYRDNQRRFHNQDPARINGFLVANDAQYLMVLGTPGSGKSTFLRHIGLEALKGDRGIFKHKCIPVLLELKLFSENASDLIKAISDELQNFGFPESNEFAIRLLEQGKILLLLDGLDEVPKKCQNVLIQKIQNLTTKYDKNRYIVSCRTAAHESSWPRFRYIELADFNDAQIKQFIDRWFHIVLNKNEKFAEICWETIKSTENSTIRELASTPLVLTFLCKVYDPEKGFPEDRATLYQKILDKFLHDWSIEKRVQQDILYPDLNPELEKEFLSKIAYQGFVNDQLLFTQDELLKSIKEFFSDIVDKPRYFNAKVILNAISIQQGVLVERAENIFSFSHLTIQEYLTAHYIYQNSQLLQDLVAQYLCDQRWHEVFLLVANLIPKADTLLECMESSAKKCIFTPRLRAILTWAEQVTVEKQESYKPEIRLHSAICISLVLALSFMRDVMHVPAAYFSGESARNLGLEFDPFIFIELVRAFTGSVHPDNNSERFSLAQSLGLSTSRAIDLDPCIAYGFRITHQILSYELPKTKIFKSIDCESLLSKIKELSLEIPDKIQSEQDNKFVAQILLDFWIEVFHLDPENLKMSEDEIVALVRYSYAIELMTKCYELAARLPENIWEGIEKRMFLTERS